MVQAGCTYHGCNQGDSYPEEFLPRLIEANKAGNFPYQDLLKTYPAKDMQQAADEMRRGITVKAVLLWD